MKMEAFIEILMQHWRGVIVFIVTIVLSIVLLMGRIGPDQYLMFFTGAAGGGLLAKRNGNGSARKQQVPPGEE